MDRDRQVLKLLNEASDILDAQGDFLVAAQLSQPIATIEARLAKDPDSAASSEVVASSGHAASQ